MSNHANHADSGGLRRTPHYAPAREAGPVKTGKPAPPAAPSPANHISVIVGADLVMVGFSLAEQAFNAGNWKCLSSAIADANSSDPQRRNAGLSAIYGATIALSDTLKAINAGGYVQINGDIPSRAEIEYSFKTDMTTFDTYWQILTKTTNDVLNAAPGLKISKSIRHEREENKPAGPLEVKVVAMPARETATKIRRNSAGEIESSIQLEQDVAQ